LAVGFLRAFEWVYVRPDPLGYKVTRPPESEMSSFHWILAKKFFTNTNFISKFSKITQKITPLNYKIT
jgi:hypothetical protein